MEALEEDIIFGRLKPGERLREEALLDRFGHSRHFIRAAFVRLEKKGIVVRTRNVGAAVRAFSGVSMKRSVRSLNWTPLNWDMRLCPKVSTVTPVRSEIKNTSRSMPVLCQNSTRRGSADKRRPQDVRTHRNGIE